MIESDVRRYSLNVATSPALPAFNVKYNSTKTVELFKLSEKYKLNKTMEERKKNFSDQQTEKT